MCISVNHVAGRLIHADWSIDAGIGLAAECATAQSPVACAQRLATDQRGHARA